MLSFYLSMLETDEERDKFTFLYEKYWDRLVFEAMKITRSQDLAEDAVHDAFLKIIENKSEILSKTTIDFNRWIVIVVRRKSIDLMRTRINYDAAVPLGNDDNTVPADGEPFDFLLIRQEGYQRLLDCLTQLDPLNRQILEMKYIHEMSFSEICAKLNMNLAQVNSRMERTKAKVRKLFGKRDETI